MNRRLSLKMRPLLYVLGLCLVVIVAGRTAWYMMRRPEVTPAMRGRRVAQEMGCFACHGPGGTGGIADPAAPDGRVPGWEPGAAAMFIHTEADVREWILHGAPPRETDEAVKAHTNKLIPMPAYEGLISEQELDDLVAYFMAVSGWAPELPDEAFEGRKIAVRLGCFGCHGPSGLGGLPNPGSYKGHIPPWDGDEFEELVHSEEELREWILDGRIRRLWDNPWARDFLERQKIQMPAYREHISDDELNKLVTYILWLRDRRI